MESRRKDSRESGLEEFGKRKFVECGCTGSDTAVVPSGPLPIVSGDFCGFLLSLGTTGLSPRLDGYRFLPNPLHLISSLIFPTYPM
jgi:hypothetical protein